MDVRLSSNLSAPLIKQLPHSVRTPKLPYDAHQWCNENIGVRFDIIDNKEGTWTTFWSGHTSPKTYDWYFKNEEDAVLFTLRWAK